MTVSKQKILPIINEIFDLIEMYGFQAYDENLTLLQHMEQSARIAEENGEDLEFVITAFLHDIGIICDPFVERVSHDEIGRLHNEIIGASFLRSRGFSGRVCVLITSQLDANRYMLTKQFNYKKKERKKLVTEDGRLLMSKSEMKEFESRPYFEDAIRLKRIDDEARDTTQSQYHLLKYRSLLMSYLTQQNQGLL